jgi:gamma-glutamylcyclotransferase (GGCT)/AIG2-like uncharacterized protein YtfP
MLKVFVYGTLKPHEKFYSIYCKDKVVKAERVWTKGELFALPVGYPAMIAGNKKVEGFLLTFTDESVLKNLDYLEGYEPDGIPDKNDYQRQEISVYDRHNKSLGKAWAYFMSGKKVQDLGGVLLPSGWWSENRSSRF